MARVWPECGLRVARVGLSWAGLCLACFGLSFTAPPELASLDKVSWRMSLSCWKGCRGLHTLLWTHWKAFGVGMGDVEGSSTATGINMNLRAVRARLRARTGTSWGTGAASGGWKGCRGGGGTGTGGTQGANVKQLHSQAWQVRGQPGEGEHP